MQIAVIICTIIVFLMTITNVVVFREIIGLVKELFKALKEYTEELENDK